MNTKPKILIFVDWYSPGFKGGGPIKSVTNIVQSLQTEFDFYIITSDRDLGDKTPYPDEKFDQWVQKDGINVAYLSEEKRKNFIVECLNKNDFHAYYFNSLYSRAFTLEPYRFIKKLKPKANVIIAPRGMLGKGALSIKPIKKKVFLNLTNFTNFFKQVKWHATDAEEKEDIQKAFGKNSNIAVVPNITRLNSNTHHITKEVGQLNLVFFSRISPKKNLKYALEILTKTNSSDVSLDIYGSVEDEEYWRECNSLISTKNIKANFKGLLTPVEVETTLSNYHFMFFPTKHENYGHVIVEALNAGCGLIISQNTPWRDLNRNKVGWDIQLNDKKGFVSAIETAASLNQKAYDDYRQNSRDYVSAEIKKQNAEERTMNLFRD